MKYLNNREEFLKISINKIDTFKDISINESDESGPFSNDIPWGNSLIGRLINSALRKAKIGANLVRINSVITRLKDTFDELLSSSKLYEMSDSEKLEYNKLLIYTFLESLKKSIYAGYKVGIIKNLTDDTIIKIGSAGEIDGKDELLKQLESFRKFLDQFKDDDGVDDPSISEEEKSEGDKSTEQHPEGETSLYPTMIKNLKSLSLILKLYKNVKLSTDKEDTNKDNRKIGKLEPGQVKVTPKDKVGKGQLTEKISNINDNETNLLQSFEKLKKDIMILENDSDKGIGITSNFIDEIVSKSLDTRNKEIIKSLYSEINRYMVGDKKSTIQEKDPLYKESIEIISDLNKRAIVAEKISIFAKIALLFDKQGLYGGLGDIGKPLESFVETIKKINTSKIEGEVKNTENVVKKNDSLLFNYSKFISYLKEADDTKIEPTDKIEPTTNKDKDIKPGQPETTSQKIKKNWDDNVNISKFEMTKEEINKIKKEFEKFKNKEEIVISGMDPIIEIVKCFNRAYKLHTTQVIPTGRSGGKVSNKTFLEYTSFGGGSPDNAGTSGGPYRNNTIFNKWEDAVLNIKRDTKYQKVFRDETTLKTEAGNIIPKAGKNLGKFMMDMLDGDDLYKGDKGKQGQQAIFLEKYFNYKVGEKGDLAYGKEEEVTKNEGVANEIKTKDLKFTNNNIKFGKANELSGSFFAADVMKGDKEIQLYFYIQQSDVENLYISYCSSFFFFKNYITKAGTALKNGDFKGDLPNNILLDKIVEGQQHIIKSVKVKASELINTDGKFTPVGKYKISYITKFDGSANNTSTKASLSTKQDDIEFKTFYTLKETVKNKDGGEFMKRFTIKKYPTDQIREIGGFTNIKASNEIEKTSIKRQ